MGLRVFVVMGPVHWNYTKPCSGLNGIAKGIALLFRDTEPRTKTVSLRDTERQWTKNMTDPVVLLAHTYEHCNHEGLDTDL